MKKNIKALLLTSVLSTISIQALADSQFMGSRYITHKGEKQLTTVAVKSKQEAYEIGYQKLKTFQDKSTDELARELKVTLGSNRIKSSINLGEAQVSVSEFMNESGEIVYQGVVNVAFHYKERIYRN